MVVRAHRIPFRWARVEPCPGCDVHVRGDTCLLDNRTRYRNTARVNSGPVPGSAQETPAYLVSCSAFSSTGTPSREPIVTMRWPYTLGLGQKFNQSSDVFSVYRPTRSSPEEGVCAYLPPSSFQQGHHAGS